MVVPAFELHSDGTALMQYNMTEAADYIDQLHWPHANKEFLWGLAIILTVIGRTMEAIGLLMQKHAHRILSNQDDDEVRGGCCCKLFSGYCTDKTWAFGFAIYLSGHILCWGSMALGTQTVLSCLMCWSTVMTMLLAPVVLGEVVTTFRLCSITMMLFGATWVTFFGPRNTAVYTVQVLRAEFGNIAFQEISAIVLLALAVFAVVAMLQKNGRQNRAGSLSDFYLTIIAAIVGWYSVLFAKCVSGLLFTSWHYREMQFLTWEAWIMTASMLILAVVNVHFLNMALAEGDAVQIIPAYESMAMVGQIFIGGIFFEELWSLSLNEHLNFWFGVTCVVFGIIAVAQKEPEGAGYEFLRKPLITPAMATISEGPAALRTKKMSNP